MKLEHSAQIGKAAFEALTPLTLTTNVDTNPNSKNMAPREPTRAQLSSKLAYSQHTPSFLLKLQNRMNGIPDEEEEGYDDDEFEYTGEGRAPIPRRPAIPERPADDPGSADDEDFEDEKPQVVVLKAGKHLTELEAENIRRKEKGLPPLPTEDEKAAEKVDKDKTKDPTSTSSKSTNQGLSFSSSSSSKPGMKPNKRKAVGQLDELKAEIDSKGKTTKHTSKKAKKQSKTLLSFGDDA